MDLQALCTDFSAVAKLARVDIRPDQIQLEELTPPHTRPSKLPAGMMAVYIFMLDDRTLKVGKVGPRSAPRYVGQHYKAGSAPSTLAASLRKAALEFGLENVPEGDEGEWIMRNTKRINLLLDASFGAPVLTLLEAFVQCRLRPRFEGFASQRDA